VVKRKQTDVNDLFQPSST